MRRASDERRRGRRVRPATDARSSTAPRPASSCWCRSSPSCYEQTGWTQGRHRLLVLRLVSDYLAGRSFSFVSAVDAIGALPPVNGVARRDGRRLGAVRGLGEDPDRRGRHRAGLRLRQVARPACCGVPSRCSSTPTRSTPLWPDTVSLAGAAGPARHRRRAVGREGDGRGGRPLADRRRRRTSTPSARARPPSTTCSPSRCTPTRCASTTARRSPTAPPRSCSRPATGPARRRDRPGLDHRLRAPHRADRARARATSPRSPSAARSRRSGRHSTASTSPSCTRRSATRS